MKVPSPASLRAIRVKMKKTKKILKKNLELRKLVNNILKVATKEKSKFWRRVADELSKPTRKRPCINLGKLNKYASKGDLILVPGKVLGIGDLDKKITIAALSFSGQAKEKISKTGNTKTLQQLLKENPKGKNVRLLI